MFEARKEWTTSEYALQRVQSGGHLLIDVMITISFYIALLAFFRHLPQCEINSLASNIQKACME